ncbi:MAG: metallophosphoesterase [Candidatus Adiutrix sp.]|jgi:predicted MPP superfamily phosphohydrolase|nr:metallophosphoesterase [Candidatus Adiutrix sp.]
MDMVIRAWLLNHRVLVFLLLSLVSQFLSWRLWLRQTDQPGLRLLIHLIFIIFNLGWLHLLGVVHYGQPVGQAWAWLDRPSLAWQMFHLLVLLPAAALASAGLGLFHFFARRRKGQPRRPAMNLEAGRRDFLKTAAGASLIGLTGLVGYGVGRQGRPPGLRRLVVHIRDLPAPLDGLVIAHISDIHLGLWFSQAELGRALDLAAAAKPHLAVFTGDLVDRDPEFARLYHEPLKALARVPHGVWAVLGNHDHYTGPERIAGLLDGHGLTMLVDRRVNLPGLPLTLVGLDDQGGRWTWLGEAEALDFKVVTGPPARPGDLKLLLNHRPEGFPQAARAGFQLYLAGHTHGGQYQLPWDSQSNLASVFFKYSSGLYGQEGGWLNVNRGLAAVGAPFRLWAWPEIDILTLKKI